MNEFAELPSEVFLKFNALTLGCLLASLLLPTAEAARHDDSKTQTVLVLGDSLSDGFGLTRAQAYPALLAKKAHAAGLQVEIKNASVSGGTTAGGLQRLPEHLTRSTDVLIVQLGINDAFRGVPLDDIRANLQAIIDAARKRNPKMRILLAGMQLPLNIGEGYLQEFGALYAQLAKKNDAALVPYLLEGVGGDPTLNIGDHIHPNAAGQRILAENVWRALEPLLRGAKTDRTG
ncbi:MAG: arylesterase [Chthoniobacterales bacterium]